MKRSDLVFWFGFASCAIIALLALAIGTAEMYIRWRLNQNFTFLGDNGLPALFLAFAAIQVAMIVAHKDR